MTPDSLYELTARLNQHEAICLEQAKATVKALTDLEQGHNRIMDKLDDLNKAGWRIVTVIAIGILPLLAWFILQVWPVTVHVGH